MTWKSSCSSDTWNLLHGVELFLRSWQILSWSRNFPHFMKSEGSSRYSQGPTTCPYSKPDQSSQSIPSVHFLKININITLLSIPGSSKLSLSLSFPLQNPVCNSPLPIRVTYPTDPIFLIWSLELYLVKCTD